MSDVKQNKQEEKSEIDERKTIEDGENAAEIEKNKPDLATEGPSSYSSNASYKWGTCPFDYRFPNVDQTKHCYVNFVDFHRCTRLFGDDEGCDQFRQCYKSMCPNSWVEKWEDQIERDAFPVRLPPPREQQESTNEEKAPAQKESASQPNGNSIVEGTEGIEKEEA